MARFSKDPVAWAFYSFEWGKGELKDFKGPSKWQLEILGKIRDGLLDIDTAIRIAISSGHGIGKSCLVSLLILWAISTFPDTKGVVTANTEAQLAKKTWAEIAKWHRLFIAKDWFTLTATALYSSDPDHEKTWRIDAIPWSDANTEAFAGLHNQGKRILLVFDEASSISDKIYEVSEGALTDRDTEIIWCCFGNPTRNTGKFHRIFHKDRHRWITRQIDSRNVEISNKRQLKEWCDDYGEDSDFVRVRVRGLFPAAASNQFIPSAYIEQARGKHLREDQYNFAAKIIGVDPALYGDDKCVVMLRQGNMSKILGVYEKIQDDFKMAGYIAQFETQYDADAVFIDMGYGTGIVSAGRQMNRNWQLVSFAGASSDPGYLNKRAEMWGNAKEWLKNGGAIPDDANLCQDLSGPEYMVNLQGKIQLEKKADMKKRGLSSPDYGDSLVLTFSYPVAPKKPMFGGRPQMEFARNDYDPFA